LGCLGSAENDEVALDCAGLLFVAVIVIAAVIAFICCFDLAFLMTSESASGLSTDLSYSEYLTEHLLMTCFNRLLLGFLCYDHFILLDFSC
jgi:hypothetical protein